MKMKWLIADVTTIRKFWLFWRTFESSHNQMKLQWHKPGHPTWSEHLKNNPNTPFVPDANVTTKLSRLYKSSPHNLLLWEGDSRAQAGSPTTEVAWIGKNTES